MTWLDDLAHDYQYMPGVVDVTFIDPAGVEHTAKAHRDTKGPTFAEISSGTAGIKKTDTVWIVWAATLDVEAEGESVLREADGTRWSVLSAQGTSESEEGRTLMITWRCVCRKEV